MIMVIALRTIIRKITKNNNIQGHKITLELPQNKIGFQNNSHLLVVAWITLKSDITILFYHFKKHFLISINFTIFIFFFIQKFSNGTFYNS